MRIVFKVPFPPSSNTSYYTDKRTNTRHLTKKGKKYKEDIRKLTGRYRDLFGKADRLHVIYVLNPPDKRKRDVMNFEKLLSDAFSKFIYPDDSQIDHAEQKRGVIEKPLGSAMVLIERL
jgi:crossover junction endodeoxyribonuclease RusA